MSIFEIQEAAQKNNDIEAYAATMHDDFEFIMHLDNSKNILNNDLELFEKKYLINQNGNFEGQIF